MLPRLPGEYRADACVPSIAGMTELARDEWAQALVGHQWPGSSALATLSAAAASRQSVGSAFHGYADMLGSVTGVLSDQQGEAGDGIRASFRAGADHARGVAERNAAKNAALTHAYRCTAELRSVLLEIADRRAGQIRSILDSPDPMKPARVAAVIAAARTEADSRAAQCMQEVYGSIQAVLDACGAEISAREFTGV